MVDHELDRLQGIRTGGIAAEPRDAVAHGRQIDHCGNAGKILQEYASRHERNLFLRGAFDIPACERLDVGGFHKAAVFVAQQVLQKNLHRVRQAGDFWKSGRFERGEAVNLDAAAINLDGRARGEGVHGRHTPVLKRQSYHVKTPLRGPGAYMRRKPARSSVSPQWRGGA